MKLTWSQRPRYNPLDPRFSGLESLKYESMKAMNYIYVLFIS